MLLGLRVDHSIIHFLLLAAELGGARTTDPHQVQVIHPWVCR